MEKAIRTAMKRASNVLDTIPDYDIIVEYKGELPSHAIHLWLGGEKEKSILMYMIAEEETYVTSAETANQLRELILEYEVQN